MKLAVWLVVLLQLLPSTAFADGLTSGGFNEAAYLKSAVVDPNYRLFWKVDERLNSIRLGVKAKTAGYVAFGISEMGGMVGSDVAVGFITEGRALVLDYFVFWRSPEGILLDQQQNITTLSADQYKDPDGNTWTSLEFERPLLSNDFNDRSIVEGPNTIIWSMGATSAFAYHGPFRGSAQITFYGGEDPTIPPGSETLNLTVAPFQLPTNYTTYACTYFNVSLPKKRHVAGWDVVVNSIAPEAVHHMVVYQCSADELKMYPRVMSYNNTECAGAQTCRQIFSAWGIGGKPVVLPENVGLPVGPGGATSLIVQFHYSNPDARTDIIDASGISFSLAPELRPEDAGVWPHGPAVSSTELISIPVGQPSWSMRSTCSSACTARSVKGNVTLFGSLLHMHAIGKQIWTEIVRPNETVPVVRADYYEHLIEQTIRLPKPLPVRAGDNIVTTCVWDSTRRNQTTPGGYSTLEEMCINFLLYWPLQKDIGSCLDTCYDPITGSSQPTFTGRGYVIEKCSENFGFPFFNRSCTYPLRNGQNVVQKKLRGDVSWALPEGMALNNTANMSVPATQYGLPPAAASACSRTTTRKLLIFQGTDFSTTIVWSSLAALGLLLQGLT